MNTAAIRRHRPDGWAIATFAVFAVGIAIRILYAFPVHKWPSDADDLLSGIRAFDILGGKLRVFYSGVRIGALESYVHMIAYLFLGPSRRAVTIAPLLSGILTLLVFFLFSREILGRRAAFFALLFLAIPSPAFLAWTYTPNGYGTTVLLCVTTLYFAARIARTGERAWTSLALGLSVGLGLWQSLQTLGCSVPALIWLLIRRPALLRSPRFASLGAAGFVIGASPWITYNAVHSLGSFRENFATKPARSLDAVASNIAYFFRYDIPELVVGIRPLGDANPSNKVPTVLRTPASLVYVLAGVAFLLQSVLRKWRPADPPRDDSGGKNLLLGLVAATAAALLVLSQPGATRGLTVRYVLPLFFLIAAATASLAFFVWNRSRALAALLALVLVTFNFSTYYMPWTPYRKRLEENAKLDSLLVSFLERSRTRWVCGSYWIVYPVDFLSQNRITGVPFRREHDIYDYDAKLPARPAPWVLVAYDPTVLKDWVERAGLHGRTVEIRTASGGSEYHLFVPGPGQIQTWSPRRVLALLRSTAPGPRDL